MARSRFCSLLFVAALGILGCGAAQAQGAEPARLADAKPGDIRLFVSGSMRAPMLAIHGQLERETGRKVVMESSESRTLQREIEAGQPFEAALMTTPVVEDMVRKGRIVAGSDKMIAVVRVGVSVRGDAPKLDVTTPEGLKKALLGAHAIRRYFGVAASVPITDNLFAKLDIEAATKDRIVALDSGNIPPEAPLASGQYEAIVNLISAIIPMKGWTYLGAIPEQFQMPVFHSAGLGATGDRTLGAKVIAALNSPEFEAALAADGITRK